MPALICFDLDGVIFEAKNFWLELHKALGTLEEGLKLTAHYLHTDYPQLVKEVVGRLWKGKDAAPYYQLISSIHYLPGVHETFAVLTSQGVQTAIISSASIDLARRAQQELGIDFCYANKLIIKDGKITGEFHWPVGAGGGKKAEIIRELSSLCGIPLQDIAYVGDSLADKEAFQVVGTSIAFNCTSAELKKHATHVVKGNDLRKILPLVDKKS